MITRQAMDAEEKSVFNPDDAYFNSIRRYPLLSREEEIKLFMRLEKGTSYETKCNHGKKETTAVLTDDAREARESIILRNLRLVITVAKKHTEWGMQHGLSLEDLIQQGNMGLMKSVDKYRCDKGVKFSTYAYWGIDRAVHSGVLFNKRHSGEHYFSDMGIDFLDCVPDRKAVMPEDSPRILEEERIAEVSRIFSVINDKKASGVLQMKYLLGYKQKDTAKAYNLSKQEIWNIETKTVRKIQRMLGVRV